VISAYHLEPNPGQISSDEMELIDHQRASLGVTVEEFRYCYDKIVKKYEEE